MENNLVPPPDCSQQDTDSLYEPNLTLVVPDYLCKEFLGILALDILHDAKGYGYLVGHKLSQLTDLLADSVHLYNGGIALKDIQNYIFKQVLTYFLELWSANITALGLHSIPVIDGNIEALRTVVLLPIRRVAGRDDDDIFIRLGKNKYGIEAQNYMNQREKLSPTHAETMTFVSPHGVKKPSDYFRQASGIVDIIRTRVGEESRVVLDMKASAGLIRTLTDPLGYTTGLPTYADPGYNMPGMSAIRQYSDLTFVGGSSDDNDNDHYTGSHEFRYCVQLETSLYKKPLKILDVTYFYGVATDGLDRSNVMINIHDETFKGTLPRSMMMASALGQYLNPKPQELVVTMRDTLESIKHLIWNYYDETCQRIPFIEFLQKEYSNLHTSVPPQLNLASFTHLAKQTSFKRKQLSKRLKEWCDTENTIFRTSYILATFQNLYFFDISEYLPDVIDCFFPKEMITEVLPKIMFDYLSNNDANILAFVYHQHKLLKQFIGQPDVGVKYYPDLDALLEKQWLPKRKGKLTTQITKNVLEWRRINARHVTTMSIYISKYIQNLVQKCNERLSTIVDLDQCGTDDPRIEVLLQELPIFRPPQLLEKVLSSHIHFYHPEMYHRTKAVVRTGLLLSSLLDALLWRKPLVQLDIDLQTTLTTTVQTSEKEYRHDDYRYDALRAVIGKFSGDFGQIMWCICHGHIFASEDNNASAMALMLHRVPEQYINVDGRHPGVWGNIHGLGDGSCVDVTLWTPPFSNHVDQERPVRVNARTGLV